MNKLKYVFVLICLIPILVLGQKNAVTEDGYQIQIFDDGTWKYVDTTLNEKRFIKENDSIFDTPVDSNMVLKSNIVDVRFSFNEDEWQYYSSSTENDINEFSFDNKKAEIYGLIISETAQIPLENLRNIALINVRDTLENLVILEEEYRTVNGIKVLYMCIEGEVEKMLLRYINYYYSGDDGVVQFITYAQKETVKQNKQVMFNLLNGLNKIKD